MKSIIITEEQEHIILKALNEEYYQMPVSKNACKPYCINPDNVLLVKKFLDKNFKKGDYESIGNDGMPHKQKIVGLVSSKGEIMEPMKLDVLLDLLIEQFKNMFLNHEERELFLKQVLKDWMNDKIGVFGTLSVNNLK